VCTVDPCGTCKDVAVDNIGGDSQMRAQFRRLSSSTSRPVTPRLPGALSTVLSSRRGVRHGAIKLSAICTDSAQFASKTATREVAESPKMSGFARRKVPTERHLGREWKSIPDRIRTVPGKNLWLRRPRV
jgi:hypothetical protein